MQTECEEPTRRLHTTVDSQQRFQKPHRRTTSPQTRRRLSDFARQPMRQPRRGADTLCTRPDMGPNTRRRALLRRRPHEAALLTTIALHTSRAPRADPLCVPTRSVRRPAPCTDPAAPQADPTPAHYCAPAHRPNADPLLRARPLRAPAARQPLCTPDSTTRRSALHVSSTACVGPRPTDGQTDSTVSPQAAAESMLSRRGMRTTIEFCASGTCTDSTCVLWVAVGAHPSERDRAVPARRSCLKPATHGVMAEHVLDEHQNRGRIGGIDARGQAGADNRLGRASSEHAQR